MNFVTITGTGKGKPLRLSQSIGNNGENLKIGIKRISGRVGWFNVEEELEWRYAQEGQGPSEAIKISPGLYNFDLLAKEFTSQIEGFEFEVGKRDGKLNMTIPERYQIWFPDRVREMFGLDDKGWLADGEYMGDRAIEFSPQRILVYLNQLSTTGNLVNDNNILQGSRVLGWIDLSNAAFGEYFVSTYEKPSFKKLQNGTIHELDFDFKVQWENSSRKLDNHDQPLDLELKIIECQSGDQ